MQQADLPAERIQLSYPFHRFTWFNVPPLGSCSYQRTMDLTISGAYVYALLQAGDTSLLIGPGNIPFEDEGVGGVFSPKLESESASAQ